MKKVLFLLLATLFLTSCEGPMGLQGPQGIQGVPGKDGRDGRNGAGTHWFSAVYETSRWTKVLDENGLFLYFEYLFDEEMLTDEVYDYGNVSAYFMYVDSEDYDVQQKLPCTINHEDNRGVLWSQVIDFNISPYSLGFRISNSDFRENGPGTLRFRVVYTWEK